MSQATASHPRSKGAPPPAPTPAEEPGATVPQPVENGNAVTADGLVSLEELRKYGGMGMQNVASDELRVPFLRILQGLSPQCEEGGAAYVEGARPGMIFNRATGDVISGQRGLRVIPVRRERAYIEWVPREAGGGFVGTWDPADPRIGALIKKKGSKFGKLTLESGNQLVETMTLYALAAPAANENAQDLERVVLSFASTQIGPYQDLISRLIKLTGSPPAIPIFAWAWKFQTVPQKNSKGSFYNWKIGPWGDSPEESLVRDRATFNLALSFHKLLEEGGARADYEGEGREPGDDEEVPF